ncbi:hypothetical protein TrRE_jg12801 [Triparma retinervis]|uniref:Neuroguidin n=1 Tax=Triparma retinervis TaxID=2557542 RepID=A0A9W7AND8_9STRA|nr:hypothetical protein TrRE_jg12801 [Triparma retinervis]
MTSTEVESCLKVVLSAAKKALDAAKELHTMSGYPGELVEGIKGGEDGKLPYVDVLAVKSSMMARYMANLHKMIVEGRDVDEGTMAQLEEMKFAMMKMKPIEKRMDYAIKKIGERGSGYEEQWRETGELDLNSAISSSVGFAGAGMMADEEGGEGREGKEVGGRGGGASDSGSDSDSDLDAIAAMAAKKSSKKNPSAAKKSSKKNRRSYDDDDDDYDDDNNTESAVYQIPKTHAVDYEGDKKSKRERQKAKNLERMRRSELLQSLQSEFSNKPETSGIDGVSGAEGGGLMINREQGRKLKEQEEERRAFEEERFVRLVTGRKEKKLKARLEREGMSVNALADDLGVGSFLAEGGRDGGGGGFEIVGREEKKKRHVNGKRIKEGDEDIGGGGGGFGERKGGKKKRGGGETALGRAMFGDGGGGKKKKKKR